MLRDQVEGGRPVVARPLVERSLVERLEAVETETVARLVMALVATGCTDPVPEVTPLAGGLLVATGARRYVNRAVGTTMAELGDDDVAGVVDFFAERGLTPEVQLSSWAPEPTLEALAGAGFAPAWCRSVLVADPRVADAVVGPPGLDIVPVADDHLGRDAADVMAAEMVLAGQDRRTSDEFMAADRVAAGTTQLLARLDGRPVGCGSLTVVRSGGATTGWLGAAATVPDARGAGVQTALVRHRLRLAAAAGCDVVGVTASVGSVSSRVLQRCGFRLVQEQWVVRRR